MPGQPEQFSFPKIGLLTLTLASYVRNVDPGMSNPASLKIWRIALALQATYNFAKVSRAFFDSEGVLCGSFTGV